LADSISAIAARAALKRKKQHEHTLEQTTAQISTLEQQVYSIEAANINRETLAAMERAGEAMQQIHGKLTIDKVDDTMYVICKNSEHMREDADTDVQGETPRTACAG
jgi:phage terminase Nu1 subunit (DNA packaging protein)